MAAKSYQKSAVSLVHRERAPDLVDGGDLLDVLAHGTMPARCGRRGSVEVSRVSRRLVSLGSLKRRARSIVQLQMRCTISSVKNSLKHSIGDLMFSKLILLVGSACGESPLPRAVALAAERRRAASAGESSSGDASVGVASVASPRSDTSLGGMTAPISGCLNHLCPPASEGRCMVSGLVPVEPHGGSRPGAGAGPPKTPSGTYRYRGAGHSEVPVLAAAAARVLV